MARRHTQPCPIAGALNLLGDQWTLMIVREAFYGTTRFGDFQRHTGISKNLLAERLSMLVAEGIFRKVDIGDHGTRYAYALTAKGRSLRTLMVALYQWGNEHVFGAGAEPVLLVDRQSGDQIPPLRLASSSGRDLEDQDILFRPGPGADEAVRRRLTKILKARGSGDGA